MNCPSCGTEIAAPAKFCPECGASLSTAAAPAREERKVVTCLFCDLVGSTARAEGADPEDVRALLSSYHERVRHELERFGGTVEKFIGDAVMALFGAPTAHEDDPERAVRAAIAIRDWASEDGDLQVRIGITTGEALITLAANPRAGEGMASGDVVNTAARLQSAAAVNSIVVDETTYRATRNTIDYREQASVDAKGKAEPVSVWNVGQARARFGVDPAQRGGAELVGRRRELGLLRDALARVREEGEVQLVTLVGVPGIGKSRLVFELFGEIAQGSELTYWRQGRALPYGEGVTFWPLAEIVKAHAGILETDAAEDAEPKLRRSVREALDDETEAEWVLGHLRPLVGLASESELGGDRRGEAFAAWRRLFEGLAENRPVVLAIDDLQWADEAMLDFVDHLVDWASGVPLLALCTARPELLDRRPGWGGGKLNSTLVALSPLAEEDTARLIALLLERSVLPAETQQELLARAGGNPLYAEEYVRMLQERGVVGRDGEGLPLPESVQGVVAARLDVLAPEEKALLQDAAVVGKVFWSGALAAIGTSSPNSVEERLHALERRDFVRRGRRSSVAGETEYAFRHVLVRDVAYAQIPRALRAAKHRLAAGWIASLSPDRSEDRAEMLAHHYLSAIEFARVAGQETSSLAEPARLALREAGDRAFALNVFSSARRFYQSALELWSEADRDRPALLLRYAHALHLTGDERRIDVLEEAREALLAVGDGARAAEADAILAEVRWHRAEADRVALHLRRAEELVQDQPASPAKARVLAQLSRYLALGGDVEPALRSGRQAFAMAQQLGLKELEAHALNNIAIAKKDNGDHAGAIAYVEQSIALAESVNSPVATRAYNNLGAFLWDVGEVGRARQCFEDAVRIGREFGDVVNSRFSAVVLAGFDFQEGNWDAALDTIDELVRSGEAGEPHYWEGRRRLERGFIRLARGDREGALIDARRGLELDSKATDPQAVAATLSLAIDLYVELGLMGEAKAVASELRSRLTDAELAMHMMYGPGFVAVADALGLQAEAHAIVERAPEGNRLRHALLAILNGNLVAAADEYAALDMLESEARLRCRAAEQLLAAGRRSEADEQLEKALAFWRKVGATYHIQQAEALLAKSA
jgi:class 3 adenylate cyclase/tetratricopeptide (TPR) repeat protein